MPGEVGDVLTRTPALGHEDDLKAVAEFAVVGSLKQTLEAVGLGLGQLDTDHGNFLLVGGDCLSSFYNVSALPGMRCLS